MIGLGEPLRVGISVLNGLFLWFKRSLLVFMEADSVQLRWTVCSCIGNSTLCVSFKRMTQSPSDENSYREFCGDLLVVHTEGGQEIESYDECATSCCL